MTIDPIGSIRPYGKTTAVVAQPQHPILAPSAAQDVFAPVSARSALRFGKIAAKPDGVVANFQKKGVLISGAAGTMGKQILDSFYQQQFNALVSDRDLEMAEKALETAGFRVNAVLGRKPEKYKAVVQNASVKALDIAKLNSGAYQQDPGFAKMGIAIEAIPENIQIKQNWVRNVEPLMTEDGIIGINTSSLSIDEIATAAQKPERVVGYHYFDLMPLPVEIIKGAKTDPAVMAAMERIARTQGKIPFSVNHDSPLAVGNRLFVSMPIEAMRMYEEGLADAKTIEEVAVEVLCPHFKDLPNVLKKYPTPFKMINKYGKLGFDIMKNAESGLGSYFKIPDTLVKEHERVQSIVNGPLKEAKAHLAEVEQKHKKARTVFLSTSSRLPQSLRGAARKAFDMDQLEAERKQAQAAVAKLEKEAQYLAKLPPALPHTKTYPKGSPEELAQRQAIADRFRGIYALMLMQMASEGLMSADDIDSMTKVAFAWNVTMGKKEDIFKNVKALQQHYEKQYGVHLEMPINVDLTKMNWVKTHLDPKTGVLSITLNRAQKIYTGDNLNTLGTPTLQAIKAAVEQANTDPNVKAIVFQAAGGKIFSGGANLEEIRGKSDLKEVGPYIQLGREVMDIIAHSPKPTIAKVQGDAYGGGVELALACKWIVASEDATFTLPEVNLGIFPAWGGTERLPQKVGKPLAQALILGGKARNGVAADPGMKNLLPLFNKELRWDVHGTGARLDAQTAERVGLAHVVAPAGHLDDVLDNFIAEGRYLQADAPEIDPARGLSTYRRVIDYPKAIQEKFNLANVEAETKRNTGKHTFPAWKLANRLIGLSDTNMAGKFRDKDLQTLLTHAVAKDKISDVFAQAGMAYFRREIDNGNRILLDAMIADGSPTTKAKLLYAKHAMEPVNAATKKAKNALQTLKQLLPASSSGHSSKPEDLSAIATAVVANEVAQGHSHQ